MATEPKIYSKSYVTGDNTYVANYGSNSVAYLYDRDLNSKFLTVGANADATAVTLEIDFYEGKTAVSRTIDTLFLLSHNWKNWSLQYWNGSAWTALASNAADAGPNSIVSFGAVTTSKVLFTVTNTVVTNAEKTIGEIMLAALSLDLAADFQGSYARQFRQKSKELQMADGSLHQVLVRFSPTRSQKYETTVKFDYLPLATASALLALKDAGEPILWQPESVTRPDQVFLCLLVPAYSDTYSSSFKGAGYSISLTVKEI